MSSCSRFAICGELILRNSPALTIALVVVTLLTPLCTQGEPVLIQSATQAKGQGWLFGSMFDASCWIAVPKHVIATRIDGDVASFRWRDSKGYEGTGQNPFIPSDTVDLAFAAAVGREPGSCLSRLGASDIGQIVARQPIVEAISMQSTHVEPERMRLRDFSSDMLVFEPVTESAKERLKPGLSGAPMVLRGAEQDRLIGMVTSVGTTLDEGYAIRADKISSLFTGYVKQNSIGVKAATEQQEFYLASVTGLSANLESSIASLQQPEGCWEAKPPENARSFQLELVAKNDDAYFSAIELTLDEACGENPDSVLLEELRGSSWVTLADCEISVQRTLCRMPRRKFSRLRLTLIKRDAATVGISQIQLLQ